MQQQVAGSFKNLDCYLMYYQHILKLNDITALSDSIRTALPISFRVNRSDHATSIVQFIDLWMPSAKKIKWVPREHAYEMSFTKLEMKQNSTLKLYRRFLIEMEEAGLIQRQELVSMLPVPILQVEPNHKVLDLCAAPGSKSKQIVECLQGGELSLLVVNDVDFKRATMAAFQVLKFSPEYILVTSNDGTRFPDFMQFDKVLCDVPCTGDGTVRKNPAILKNWGVQMAHQLYPAQVQLLLRGLLLLKVGGELVYSTCSLNPIEDEAVVQVALVGLREAVQLCEIENIPGSNGLINWQVCYKPKKTLIWFDTFSEVNIHGTKIKPSMFPLETLDELKYCRRVLPNLNNTGGFFIAKFKKLKDFESSLVQSILDKYLVSLEIIPQTKNDKPKQISTSNSGFSIQHLHPVDLSQQAVQNSIKFYGLSDPAILKNLYVIGDGSSPNCFLVSKALQDLIVNQTPETMQLKIILCGLKILQSFHDTSTDLMYRIVQDGLPHIYPHLTQQTVTINLTQLLVLLTQERVDKQELAPEIMVQLEKLAFGPFVFVLTQEGHSQTLVCMRNGHKTVSVYQTNDDKIRTLVALRGIEQYLLDR